MVNNLDENFQALSITLGACTVFWKELGLKPTYDNGQVFFGYNTEIIQWLVENAKKSYNIHETGVWFIDPQDAMLFKLVWAGNAG